MNVICPCCQAVFPLDSALEELAHRQAYTELLALTPFPELLPGYLRLFSPAKKALSGVKKARLTAELVTMIKAARFEFKRVSYNAPIDYWRMGFEMLQAKRDNGSLDLPLQSHNLLLTVIAAQINKAEQRKEQVAEDHKAGRTPIGAQFIAPAPSGVMNHAPTPDKPRGELPDNIKAELTRLKRKPHDTT